MKITVTKVIRELEKKHGWEDITKYQELIKDTLKVIDEQLIRHKNISILNTIK